jgi:hypothetical protein
MKRLSLVLAIAALILPQSGHAGWWKTYGPGGDGYCVQVTSDSDYIVCGAKGSEVWLLKIDTLGNLVWSRTYVGGDGLWAEETSDRGYIIAKSPGLIKVDSAGDTLWTRDYDIATNCVQETFDKGYIVAGVSFNERLALVKTNQQGDSLWTRFYNRAG